MAITGEERPQCCERRTNMEGSRAHMKSTEPAVVANLERQASTQASCLRAVMVVRQAPGLRVREATASSPNPVTNCHT